MKRDTRQLVGDVALADLVAFLDDSFEAIEATPAPEAVFDMADGLCALRRAITPGSWRNTAVPVCRAHSLFAALHEDPCHRRAYVRPRGYIRDAVVVDQLLGVRNPSGSTHRAEELLGRLRQSPIVDSLRHRYDVMAGLLDELPDRSPSPRVLAVGAGHLREAEWSAAVRSGRVDRYVAVDHDPMAIEVVRVEQGPWGVDCRTRDLGALLDDKGSLGEFDLVYSLLLLDRLEDWMAQRLVSSLFRSLAPGGRLVVANAMPDCEGAAYVEVFMDWFLRYRSEDDLRALLGGLHPDEIGGALTWLDPRQNVGYLEVERSGGSSI